MSSKSYIFVGGYPETPNATDTINITFSNSALAGGQYVMPTYSVATGDVGKLIISTPAIGEAVRSTIEDVVLACHEIAVCAVSDEPVYRKFQAAGHQRIRWAEDIFTLDLARVENVIGRLHVRYEAEAALEGAAAGTTDAVEIISDAPALVALSLSAISQYRAHYGLTSTQYERMFAMHILSYSSGASVGAKSGARVERAKPRTFFIANVF